jgi:hypothetical protein
MGHHHEMLFLSQMLADSQRLEGMPLPHSSPELSRSNRTAFLAHLLASLRYRSPNAVQHKMGRLRSTSKLRVTSGVLETLLFQQNPSSDPIQTRI